MKETALEMLMNHNIADQSMFISGMIVNIGDEYWLNADGKIHRENGPAIIRAKGTKVWAQNGKMHRFDGPAVEYSDGAREYWEFGKYMARHEPWRRPDDSL